MSGITANEGILQTDKVALYDLLLSEQAKTTHRPSMHLSLLLYHGEVLRMLN